MQREPLCAAADVEALFRQHHEHVVRLVTRRLGGSHRELAEEAAQFAWLELLRRPPSHEYIVGWLVLTAVRHGWHLLAHERRHELTEHLSMAGPHAASVEQQATARADLAAIARLGPEGQRQALSLRMLGFSYAEIAEITGRSYTWVNRHITEGRAALRILIDV